MDMPISRFWLFNKSIERIQAQCDFRSLRVARAAQATEEGLNEFVKELTSEIGQARRVRESLDVESFERLRKAFS